MRGTLPLMEKEGHRIGTTASRTVRAKRSPGTSEKKLLEKRTGRKKPAAAGNEPDNSLDMALAAARAALDKKAADLEILSMAELVYYTDYFVICSATSTTQVAAVADNVANELARLGRKPSGQEGKSNALWVLLDYGDFIVHVFERETREFYALEKLWLDAQRVELNEDTAHLDR